MLFYVERLDLTLDPKLDAFKTYEVGVGPFAIPKFATIVAPSMFGEQVVGIQSKHVQSN